VGFVVLFTIGFWGIAGFVPPPAPRADAQQIAALFRDDANSIRLGMLITALAAVLIIPWAAAVSTQLRRIEGRHEVWASIQFGTAAISALLFELLVFLWLVATFRGDRNPEIVQTLNDLGWVTIVGLIWTVTLEAVAIGIAILGDKRRDPIFPRWAGYANIWCATLFLPGQINVFFKEGPFAWNGLLAWYVPLTVFCAWFAINLYIVLKAITRQEENGAPVTGSAASGVLDNAALTAEVAALRAELVRSPAG
jgi:hypothetical protein